MFVTRMAGLRSVVAGQQLMVLRIPADRHRPQGEDHIRMISQLHQLLLELIFGGRQEEPVRGPGARRWPGFIRAIRQAWWAGKWRPR
jgi:hypothetical protein